jgi:microcystin-dependent protein
LRLVVAAIPVDDGRLVDIEWTSPVWAILGSGYGAPGRTRTADAGLRTASLCPLSYGGALGRS